MRVLTAVLVTILMVSFVAMPAQAAAPNRTPGFVQLLTNVRDDVPVEVQAQDALAAVMPQVLAAQRRGQIEEFELSPSSGVLKLVYNASAGKPDFAGRPVHDDMQSAAAEVNIPSGARQSPATSNDVGGATAPHFALTLYDNYVDASGLTASWLLVGQLQNASGQIVSTYSSNIDVSGNTSGYFNWYGFYTDFLPGYKVTFQECFIGCGAPIASMTVPNLKFTSINKSTSKVAGKAPSGKPYAIWWYHLNLDALNTYVNPSHSGNASGTGSWSYDFGTTPFRGGDYFDVYSYPNATFTWHRWIRVPMMYCNMVGGICDLYGWPFTPASIGIIHAGTTYTFNGTFDAWGQFWINLTKPDGTPIPLAAGDPVSGTGVTGYLLPKLTASIDAITDVVSGKAPKSKYFNLGVANASNWYWKWSHANSSGNYSTDFTSSIDIGTDFPYRVSVYFINKGSGNITELLKGIVP